MDKSFCKNKAASQWIHIDESASEIFAEWGSFCQAKSEVPELQGCLTVTNAASTRLPYWSCLTAAFWKWVWFHTTFEERVVSKFGLPTHHHHHTTNFSVSTRSYLISNFLLFCGQCFSFNFPPFCLIDLISNFPGKGVPCTPGNSVKYPWWRGYLRGLLAYILFCFLK